MHVAIDKPFFPLAFAVLLAVVVCMLSSCSLQATGPNQAEFDRAAATLPALTLAEPDPNRPRYVRDEWQPSGWADLDRDGCNTRKEVLITEATTPPDIGDGCRISRGQWRDRFSGKITSDATTLQIDHLVALADAHRSGGWAWSSEKRVAFANNIDDPDALNAIDGKDNQAKGDKAPDAWLPASKEGRCEYVYAYARIKATWSLTTTKEQWKAIVTEWAKCPGST